GVEHAAHLGEPSRGAEASATSPIAGWPRFARWNTARFEGSMNVAPSSCGDDWPDRFPAFPEYVIDCYRCYASFPFRTDESQRRHLPDEVATLAGACLSLLDPENVALHEEIGGLLYPVMAQVENRRAF